MRSTASAFVASQPSPQTVSVVEDDAALAQDAHGLVDLAPEVAFLDLLHGLIS